MRVIGLANHGARLAGIADERAGLHGLHQADVIDRQHATLGGEVEHLAADHAGRAGGAAEQGGEHDADFGRRVEARDDLEGEGEEGVTGKDGGRLVKGLVDGRPTAAEIVVVHGGQVVMGKAVAMQAFERGGGVDRRRAGLAEQGGAFNEEKRAEALPAGKRRMAHGRHQPFGPGDLAGPDAIRKQAVEACFGLAGDGAEAGLEGIGHATGLKRKRVMVKPDALRAARGDFNPKEMVNRAARQRIAAPPARRRGGVLRFIGRFLVILLLIPVVLTPVYRLVNPVSTLMIYERLANGPIDRQWVPLDQIAVPLLAATVMSEDGQFCRHRGVDWGELRAVLKSLDEASRGASTISMQTVKNLYLWNSRSYVRKAVEIPLALYADAVLGKRRMMEIYLNIAEFGPGIFGAEAAARRYFGVPASALNYRQAALLVASLPNPGARNPAAPSRTLQALAARLTGRAQRAGSYIDCLRSR